MPRDFTEFESAITFSCVIQPLEPRLLLATNAYLEQDLVSDGSVAANHVDSHLVNPWGLAVHGHGIQVADADASFSTSYDASGNSTGPAVRIPGPNSSDGSPTGVVANSDTAHFLVDTSSGPSAAQFIYATEEGTIDAWATANKNRHPVVVADRSSVGSSYKGLALASVGNNPFLYAANFSRGRIDVFDSTFKVVRLSGGFVDPKLPKNYSPFNIQKIGSQLFVAYAKHNTGDSEEIKGASTGVIDIFKTDGTFVKRFAAGKTLNAPWGMAQAPSSFAAFSNDILIGNFGDGRISAFDPVTGAFQGQLDDSSGDPIEIDGLWGLAFGNGKAGTLKNGLYFTAGIDDEAHGLYGRLIIDTTYVFPQSVPMSTNTNSPTNVRLPHRTTRLVDVMLP
jgi:uncharacterized protein (TIGR03118 family)